MLEMKIENGKIKTTKLLICWREHEKEEEENSTADS
jgi:hypothetical protein